MDLSKQLMSTISGPPREASFTGVANTFIERNLFGKLHWLSWSVASERAEA